MRDSRRQRTRLLFFLSSIAIGVASLVAVQSLAISLKESIDAEAKTLLGADLQLESASPLPDSIRSIVDSLQATQVREASFASMALFQPSTVRGGAARLVQARALEPGFPFYGSWQTVPALAVTQVWEGPYALVDEVLANQFQIKPGDSLRLGIKKFAIAGILKQVAGESAASFTGPRIIFDYRYLANTRLVQVGSRVSHKVHLKLPDNANADTWAKAHKAVLDGSQVRAVTVKMRQGNLGRSFDNLFSFLNLMGFIALILGGVGVAGAVQVYMRERIPTVALLRCMGASGVWASRVYLVQVLVTAAVGSLLGVALGSVLLYAWPYLLQGLLPVAINVRPNIWALILGLGTGICITLLFSALPLVAIRSIAPLQVLRGTQASFLPRVRNQWLFWLAICMFILCYATWKTQSWRIGLAYSVGMAAATLLLAAVALVLVTLVRKFFPQNAPYSLRQGLANLFRPGNQTLPLIVTLGLGMFLLFTIYLVQANLLQQADLSTASSQHANMLLFDIQPDQRKGLHQILARNDMRAEEEAPVVTVRIRSVRGKSFATLRADSSLSIPVWAGEYRVSYRDSLLSSERITQGVFTPKLKGDSIYISIGEDIAQMFRFKLGDAVVFDVQGVPLTAYIGSVRRINYLQARPSYLWLFPTGVLEDAPQFYLLYTRVTSTAQSSRFQQELVQQYPNISVVDFAAILATVSELVDRIALVIQFLASFSLLAGVLVLLAAILGSQDQRLRENALLRTLGAQRSKVFIILCVEYTALGILASTTGLLLALAATYSLNRFVFEIPFTPSWPMLLLGAGALILAVIMLGVIGGRRVVLAPPLQVLREA